MYQNLEFVIPRKYSVDETSFQRALMATDSFDEPFLTLMAARFWHAARACSTMKVGVSDGSSINPNTLYVVRDFFLDNLPAGFVSGDDLASKGSYCIELAANLAIHDRRLGAGLSSFAAQREGRVDNSGFIAYGMLASVNALNSIEVPLGCPTEWLPGSKPRRRSIIIDEPHFTINDILDDYNDIRIVSYRHALEVCANLHKRGYEIETFCRTQDSRVLDFLAPYNFVSMRGYGKWTPFHETLELYSSNTLFYSWFPETFGFPIVENLQIGNGVIAYSETINPTTIRSMQNGALVSIYMDPMLAADIIDAYFRRYVAYNLRRTISEEAFVSFSTDTFADRLIEILKYNKILTPVDQFQQESPACQGEGSGADGEE